MNGLLGRLVLRGLSRERARALLAILAVALGVSVFLAIRLANRAAVGSFENFARGVASGSEWVLRRDAGALREDQLKAFLPMLDKAWLLPVVEGSFTRRATQESFQITGIDLLGVGDAMTGTNPPKDSAIPWLQALENPFSVFIASSLAHREGLRSGDELEGYIGDRPVRLRVGGIMPDPANRPRLERTQLVMDLPAAQALLHQEGLVDRVECGPREGFSAQDLEPELRRWLPNGWILEPPQARASSGKTMTAAFRFNLTILSLIALAVGAYLLFQGFDAMVMRRQETWATLRALGCPPGLLHRLVLAEAALLGGIGSALGVLLGWGLAQGAVRAVARTVDALYGSAGTQSAGLHPGEASAAFFLGWGTCLLAAWIPARQAASTPAVQLLSRGSHARPAPWRSLTLLGLLLLVAGLLIAFLPHPPPGQALHAYAGSFLVLVGGSLGTLGLLPLLGLVGRGASGWRLRLAFRPLQRPTGRHAYAAAALAVAVGMTVGMGIMVQSFETTVKSWIGATLRADLYVSPQGATGAASRHRISPATLEALKADGSLAATDTFHLLPIQLRNQNTFLGAGDLEVHGTFGHMSLLGKVDAKDVLVGIHRDGEANAGAVISETFSRRFGVKTGDTVDLPTHRGPKGVVVRGVYADYGNERGSLIIDRVLFLTWFDDPRPASAALYLRPGQDAEATAQRLGTQFPGLQIRANQRLRAQVEQIFRQTFAITYALELVGLAVALAGLSQSLIGLALGRRGELWTLRALGMERGGLSIVLMGEGLGVALAGTLGGLGLGWLLAQILVRVLNPQVFGWTLRFALPWDFLLAILGFITLAAILVLLPVARWGARLQVDREAEEGA